MLACTCIHNLHPASDCSLHAGAHSPRTSTAAAHGCRPFSSAGVSLASLAHKISHARNVRYNFIGFCATGALSHDIHGAKSGSADAPPSHPPLPASALQQQPASAACLVGLPRCLMIPTRCCYWSLRLSSRSALHHLKLQLFPQEATTEGPRAGSQSLAQGQQHLTLQPPAEGRPT